MSRSAKAIAFSLLGSVLIGLVVLYVVSDLGFLYDEQHPAYSKQIRTVPHVSSEEDLYLDVEEDSGETLHLIWHSKEGGVRYQRSGNEGESWTDPTTLAAPTGDLIRHRPRIFHHDGELTALWWDRGMKTGTSADGGQTWSRQSRPLFQDTTAPGTYALTFEEETAYLTFSNRDGVFFSRSEDFGQTWSQPTKVSSDVETYISDPPDLAASGEDVYLLWALNEKLFWARSTDGGRTWDKSTPIDTDRSRFGEIYGGGNYFISQPTIAASEAGISAFYRERGVFHHWKPKDEKQWSPVTRISSHSAFQLTACSKGNRRFAGWADTRYRKRFWWDIIPGASFFLGDPFWENSDLFVRSVEGDTVGELLRLTPLSPS